MEMTIDEIINMDDIIVDIPTVEAYTKDEVIKMLKNLQQNILGHQRFQSSTTLTRVVKTTDVEIEIDKTIDTIKR